MHDPIELLPFAPDWEQYPNDAANRPLRERYVAEEIMRVVRAGDPILRTILMHYELRPAMADEAINLLRTGALKRPSPNFQFKIESQVSAGTVHLRVRPGVEAPERDPNGRLVQGEPKERPLHVKIGNTGGDIKTEDAGQGVNSIARRQLQQQYALYRTVTINRTPTMLPLDHAVIALKQWGYGIAAQIRRSLHEREGVKLLDTWLVEEVLPEAKPAFVPDSGHKGTKPIRSNAQP